MTQTHKDCFARCEAHRQVWETPVLARLPVAPGREPSAMSFAPGLYDFGFNASIPERSNRDATNSVSPYPGNIKQLRPHIGIIALPDVRFGQDRLV